MSFVPAFGPPGPASVYGQGALANRLYRDETIVQRYRQTMQDLLSDVWNEDTLLADVSSMKSKLKKDLHARQKNMPQAIKRLEKFIKTRREKIEKELDAWPAKIADRPRKPAYIVQVGAAKGSFDTPWAEKPVRDAAQAGELDMHLTFQGKEIQFKQQGAAVYQRPEMRFPFGFGGPPQQTKPTADFVLSGIRDEDGKPVRITIGIEIKTMLENVGQSIDVSGMFMQGEQPMFGFSPDTQMIRGQLKLTKASETVSEAVQGEFDLQIVELHGGLFDQFRQMPGGPGTPPGTNRQGAPPAAASAPITSDTGAADKPTPKTADDSTKQNDEGLSN
jgi:hypothetical protein